jgi:tetratricopeptide (TPR) repeat protein
LRKLFQVAILLFCFSVFAVNGMSPDFVKIVDTDDTYGLLIKNDFKNITYADYFYFYCLVSGELDGFESYKKWFVNAETIVENEVRKDFGRTDIVNLDNETRKKFAENLLVYLHKSVFGKYESTANLISDVADKRTFNCLSSSIIYMVFLKKYGFNCKGVETQDHVFIQVEFPNEKIDVETTNPYGFDPGKKREVLDQFGKTTGFTYVPAIDYKNRNTIDPKKIFFLVCHNLAQMYFSKGDYMRALNLGYVIYKGRNDEHGDKDFNDLFNNYLAVLYNSKKYVQAIDDIESYFELFDMTEYFVNLRFDMMYRMVLDWSDYKNFDSMKNYLETKNAMYSEIKNSKRYSEIVFNLYLNAVNYNNARYNFDSSYTLIKEFNSKFKNDDMEKLFSNTVNDQIAYSSKAGILGQMPDVFSRLKAEFPDYNGTIASNVRIYSLKNIYDIYRTGNYEKALAEAKKMKSVYPNDADFSKLLYSCHLQYTITMYNSKNFELTVASCEDALKEFPGDKLLENNFKAFFINFFEEAYGAKDYSKARKILNKALEKYPDQSEIIDCDIRLKQKNY